MKTTYWLVTAAAVAAAGVTVYARLPDRNPPLPKAALSGGPVATPDVPRLTLPPVVLPPDEQLALPRAPDTGADPLPLPVLTTPKPDVPALPPGPKPDELPVPPLVPVAPIGGTAPLIPPLPAPALPALPAVPAPVKPVEPLSPAPLVPVAPRLPETPSPAPPVPAPYTPPVLEPPVISKPTPTPPQPLPLPTPQPVLPPAGPLAVEGKFVVLNNDKLIEGDVTLSGDKVIVRYGALDRPFPKSQVQFVGASKDEVYKFMLAKVAANDPTERLRVARWCMLSGMREQALTEAYEVKKLQPVNKAAADMIRSLEASLAQFPPEGGGPRMVAPTPPTFTVELRPTVPPMPPPTPPSPPTVDPEPDVSAEAALVFGSRVQPFLANQCASCHAKSDYAGTFKLVRVNPAEAGPMATRTNLRAVAGQLKKDDPAARPLLVKSLTAHGGMKQPATGRNAPVYLALEGWVALAVGTPLAAPPAVPPMTKPTAPVLPPVEVAPPVRPVSPVVPPEPIALPPVKPIDPDPIPLPLPVPVPSAPTLPAVPVTPAIPPAPVVPLIPRADPLIPTIPPALPSGPAVPLPALPKAPAVPPPVEALPPLPVVLPPAPPPTVPKPATGAPPFVAPPSQFGTTAPPKPPVTGPSGDEFDPAGFNRGK
jgi:hypothetical protein